LKGRDSEQGKQRENKAIANLPEFARRIQDLDSGKAKTVSGEEV
jgi:hypothetical protein